MVSKNVQMRKAVKNRIYIKNQHFAQFISLKKTKIIKYVTITRSTTKIRRCEKSLTQ